MTQNVVMYTVEVEADNASNILLPYLTAKVQFEVQKQTDALVVPNSALRWNPLSTSELSPEIRATLSLGAPKPAPAPPQRVSATQTADRARPRIHHGTVWIRDAAYVRPVEVTLGTTDGSNTAVSADGLHEGDQVVISESNASADASQRSPFLPQMIRR
jgi:HlyD family secretion protein